MKTGHMEPFNGAGRIITANPLQQLDGDSLNFWECRTCEMELLNGTEEGRPHLFYRALLYIPMLLKHPGN